MRVQWFQWGGNSLLLTVVNICCVLIVGVLVLRAKEFGPLGHGAHAEHSFWKEDLALARKLRKSVGAGLAPDQLKSKVQSSLQNTRAPSPLNGAFPLNGAQCMHR